MILYAVEALGDITNSEPSIVTIHKTKVGATNAMIKYEKNCKQSGADTLYSIYEIDTDSNNDCIYDFDR